LIRLFNSMTRRLEVFEPLRPGHVSMYHCGPTVYSSPHIGNFRAFLLADLLRRLFEDRGFAVRQVMNITDVGHMTDDDEDRGEDKLEREARRARLDPVEIARRYEDEFRSCLQALAFRMPHEMPRASEHIAEMGAIIARLRQQGYAYQVGGNVYFEIAKFPGYGRLSGKDLDQLGGEHARLGANPEKRDPRDFALWKVDPKHIMQWDAPFPGGQRGFPGWHIECSAMAMKYLGESFDLHTGGEDNLFPHHECEVAQSEAATGKPFVRTWLHVKHLMVDGQKMSKSTGNFTTVSGVLQRGYSGIELRYTLMRVQYRQTLNFTFEGLEDSRRAIRRVQQARRRLVDIRDGAVPAGRDDLGDATAAADAAFTAALCDDLNTSEALAAVFALVAAANRVEPSAEGAAAALAAFARFEDVLGCFGPEPAPAAAGAAGDEQPAEVRELLAQREAARAARDFATADRLRGAIEALGFRVVDTAEGPRAERR
jgi:cysteinyl-tRNA synthetase